jgi:hypothetical protein
MQNKTDEYIYFHVRVDREHYNQYKQLCKDNGDTVATNLRRYIYAVCKQADEVKNHDE